MAAVYLDAAYGGEPPDGLAVARRNERDWGNVLTMARRGINAPVTSSAGRLFDAAAALIGVRDVISYEGQAAIELEQLADPAERGSYPASMSVGPDGRLLVSGADLIRAAAEDLAAGVAPAVIAGRFHNGVAGLITAVCAALRDRCGLTGVALSGGVFQNLMLSRVVVTELEQRGFTVLVHGRVPCNDGGISLGQAVIAAARDGGPGGWPEGSEPGPAPR
jgi:hydrogenase maturation protein HypF